MAPQSQFNPKQFDRYLPAVSGWPPVYKGLFCRSGQHQRLIFGLVFAFVKIDKKHPDAIGGNGKGNANPKRIAIAPFPDGQAQTKHNDGNAAPKRAEKFDVAIIEHEIYQSEYAGAGFRRRTAASPRQLIRTRSFYVLVNRLTVLAIKYLVTSDFSPSFACCKWFLFAILLVNHKRTGGFPIETHVAKYP
ncbi:MAG: hypothetical protein GXP01_08930 [Alphaproteobacteria bacterium]|nr:hypothetical protein [Alphaproteobacteria bacterium]